MRFGGRARARARARVRARARCRARGLRLRPRSITSLAETALAMPRSSAKRTFVISLDDPPEVRWREVFRAFKPQITALLRASEDLEAFDALGPSARFACRKLLLALPSEQR